MAGFLASYDAIRAALAARYGRTTAATSPSLETVLDAFLRVSHEETRVGRALGALREAGLLEADSLASADPAELRDILHGAGASLKPAALRPLQEIARYLASLGAEPEDVSLATEQLRDDLRRIRGVGAASADAVLLHGLGRAVYPVDRGTYRVLVRHGWIDSQADYDEASALLTRAEPENPSRLSELAHDFERVAAEFCKARSPKCERCPLRPYLPASGPLDPAE